MSLIRVRLLRLETYCLLARASDYDLFVGGEVCAYSLKEGDE